MSLKMRWIIVCTILSLPYVVLGAAGFLWLYERNWSFWWISLAVVFWLIGGPLLKWLQKLSKPPIESQVETSANWPPAGRSAWQKVEEIAARPALGDLPIDRPEPIWDLFREVLETVAREFHPKSDNPLAEVPVPHLLRMAELVARDLRDTVSQNIPGAHILTINDLVRLKRLALLAPTLYRFYRIVTLVVNPAAALARELNAYVQHRVMNASAQETKRWALQFVVKKAGYYAIELYSGHLILPDVEFAPYTSPSARSSLIQEKKRDEIFGEEPLRILVLGQVKAGKSSLINALFGETKAAVDVVPRTRHVEPYLLERDGLNRAIILDTAGYEDPSQSREAIRDAREELLKCDLILLTCSALSGARGADRILLDEVRAIFQQDPNREFPPLVVVLTHVDQLRPFREWNPPYDIVHPQGTKAENMRAALDVTAADLLVEPGQVVPVCLNPGHEYNVQEGLIPAILNSLGAAQRLKYLRCLREFKDEEYWSRLWEQSGNTGRIIVRAGFNLLDAAGRKLDAFTSLSRKK